MLYDSSDVMADNGLGRGGMRSWGISTQVTPQPRYRLQDGKPVQVYAVPVVSVSAATPSGLNITTAGRWAASVGMTVAAYLELWKRMRLNSVRAQGYLHALFNQASTIGAHLVSAAEAANYPPPSMARQRTGKQDPMNVARDDWFLRATQINLQRAFIRRKNATPLTEAQGWAWARSRGESLDGLGNFFSSFLSHNVNTLGTVAAGVATVYGGPAAGAAVKFGVSALANRKKRGMGSAGFLSDEQSTADQAPPSPPPASSNTMLILGGVGLLAVVMLAGGRR